MIKRITHQWSRINKLKRAMRQKHKNKSPGNPDPILSKANS